MKIVRLLVLFATAVGLLLATLPAAAAATVHAPTSVRAFVGVAHLSGGEEVPPVQTAARGLAVFWLRPDGSGLQFDLSTVGLTNVTGGHIHLGAPGVNGPVVVNLVQPDSCTIRSTILRCTGTITGDDLTGPLAGQTLDDLLAAMSAGSTYTNVHTTAHPGGEIRGQIDPTGAALG
ncbi:MAG: CHRD domain-containing protein [Chloroflexota bacterium]